VSKNEKKLQHVSKTVRLFSLYLFNLFTAAYFLFDESDLGDQTADRFWTRAAFLSDVPPAFFYFAAKKIIYLLAGHPAFDHFDLHCIL